MLRKVFPSSLGSMERSFVTREQCLPGCGSRGELSGGAVADFCCLRFKVEISVLCNPAETGGKVCSPGGQSFGAQLAGGPSNCRTTII